LLNILKGTNAGTWEWNVQTGAAEFNDRWAEMMGKTLKELEPIDVNTWVNNIHPDDLPKVNGLLNKLFNREIDCCEMDFRQPHKDSSWIWVNSRGKVIEWTNEGKPLKLSGTNIDITERKLAEEALRESEEKLNIIINTSPIGICTVDSLGNFLTTNLAYERMVGYSKEECRNLSFYDFTHPNDRPKNKKLFQSMFSLDSIGFSMKKRYVRKDGLEIDVDVHAIGITNSDGNVKFGTAFVDDITERKRAVEALKESEEQLRNIFENSTNIFYSHDADLNVTYVSPQVKEILGYSQEEAMTNWAKLFSGNPMNEIRFENTLNALIKGIRQPVYKLELVRKDGRKIIVEVRESPLIKDGKTLSVIGSFTDITDRVTLESRLRQAQKMEAIGTLAGGIAHDFNNVLYGIMGYTEMTMDDLNMDSDEYSNLEEVLKATKIAKGMVQQILSFSRKTDIKKSPLRVQSIVNEVVKLLKTSIPTTIEIRQSISKGLNPILADATQIHQVILNLCTNAYYAMKKDGGVLELALSEIELHSETNSLDLPSGAYIELTVSDSGTGMGHDVLERIFDPYFTTKPIEEGTGMGLAVVHGIIKAHEGEIVVNSELGKGTVFQVYLPCLKAEEIHRNVEYNQKLLYTGTENILLIDDNRTVLSMTNKLLSHLGYKVESHLKSLSGLEAFQKEPEKFDLIITDMTMPHMTGLEFFNSIKAINPEIPVILCSGFSEFVDEKSAKEKGFSAFIQKPVIKSQIAEVVRNVLDGKVEQNFHTPK